MDVDAPMTVGVRSAYGEVVWSWRRDRGVYFAGGYLADNGDNQRRSPGRARISRKAIARGKSGCLGCTCSPCPCASHMGCPCAPAHGIYGRSQRPAFPAPFHHERDNEIVKLGRIRVARMRGRAKNLIVSTGQAKRELDVRLRI